MKVQNKDYDYYPHTKINNISELLELMLKSYANDIAFSYKID